MKFVVLVVGAGLGALLWIKLGPIATLLVIAVLLLWRIVEELEDIHRVLKIAKGDALMQHLEDEVHEKFFSRKSAV